MQIKRFNWDNWLRELDMFKQLVCQGLWMYNWLLQVVYLLFVAGCYVKASLCTRAPRCAYGEYFAGLSMDDPRDEPKNEVILTDSSDDELADLEKEYAAKRQKLLELRKEKAKLAKMGEERRRNTAKNELDEVVPGPKEHISRSGAHFASQLSNLDTTAAKKNDLRDKSITRMVAKVKKPDPSGGFAAGLERAGGRGDQGPELATRQFEFTDIPPALDIDLAESDRDEVSGFRLRKRYIQPQALQALLADKKVLRIEKLLAKVCPPAFHEPAYANWCLVGLVLEKLEPIASKLSLASDAAANFIKEKPAIETTKTKSNKYIKISVGNFAHSVRVMLFGAAVDRWWKLRVGDVVCILNPNVNRWQHKTKTGFNLALNTAVDCILEIGLCRDFGKCGFETGCNTMIDTSQGTLCGYHQDLHFRKYASKRMELNGSVLARRPDDRANDRRPPSFVPYSQANERTKTFAAAPGIDRAQYTDPQELARRNKAARVAARVAALAKRGSLRDPGGIRGGNRHGDPDPKAVHPFTSATLKNIGYDPVPRKSAHQSRNVQQLLRAITSQINTRLLRREPKKRAAPVDYSSDSSLEIE
jgi:minichromosome maintenance protein 10